MPKQSAPIQPGLGHVVVAGGTPAEWLEMSVGKWDERLRAVARAAAAEGAHWVTVVPHHGPDFSEDDLRAYARLMTSEQGDRSFSVAWFSFCVGTRRIVACHC
jgi:hypothetical protein